jgi:hypothetical protein
VCGAVLDLDCDHGFVIEGLDPGGMLGCSLEETVYYAVRRPISAFGDDFLGSSPAE